MEKLAESMEEQDMIDSLEKALDEETKDQEMPQQPIPADRPAPDLAAPVEKRRRKKSNKTSLSKKIFIRGSLFLQAQLRKPNRSLTMR